MTRNIAADANALELRLPEDRSIHLLGLEDLVAVAKKLGKPVIRELVYREPGETGPGPAGRSTYLLAVYDGPWAYYCEVEEEKPEKRAPASKE